jgi:hypothetical protein
VVSDGDSIKRLNYLYQCESSHASPHFPHTAPPARRVTYIHVLGYMCIYVY